MRRAGGAVQGCSLPTDPAGELRVSGRVCPLARLHGTWHTVNRTRPTTRSTLRLVLYPRCTCTHSLAASVVAYDVSPCACTVR